MSATFAFYCAIADDPTTPSSQLERVEADNPDFATRYAAGERAAVEESGLRVDRDPFWAGRMRDQTRVDEQDHAELTGAHLVG